MLPGPLALVVFDAAVNSGPGRAVRWLQAALGVQ
jgi:lysozyme family protein